MPTGDPPPYNWGPWCPHFLPPSITIKADIDNRVLSKITSPVFGPIQVMDDPETTMREWQAFLAIMMRTLDRVNSPQDALMLARQWVSAFNARDRAGSE